MLRGIKEFVPAPARKWGEPTFRCPSIFFQSFVNPAHESGALSWMESRQVNIYQENSEVLRQGVCRVFSLADGWKTKSQWRTARAHCPGWACKEGQSLLKPRQPRCEWHSFNSFTGVPGRWEGLGGRTGWNTAPYPAKNCKSSDCNTGAVWNTAQ